MENKDNNKDKKNYKPGDSDEEEFNWRKNLRPILFWAFIVVAAILIWESLPGREGDNEKEIPYTGYTFQDKP